MQPSGPGKWSGQIYNADDGSSYASSVSVAGPNALKVEGCVGALCGGGLCGVIVGLKEPIDPATGKPQVDDKNPNPALKKRPMIGLTLFSGMQPSGPNKWSGQIYNADDGSNYASSVSVAGPDTLRVEGCVGALCGGETWTRVGR